MCAGGMEGRREGAGVNVWGVCGVYMCVCVGGCVCGLRRSPDDNISKHSRGEESAGACAITIIC